MIPQTELAMRGSNGLGKGALKGERGTHRSFWSERKHNLVTLALVFSKRKTRPRTQSPIFKIENQHLFFQMAPQASWPQAMPADNLESGNLENRNPGIWKSGSPLKKRGTIAEWTPVLPKMFARSWLVGKTIPNPFWCHFEHFFIGPEWFVFPPFCLVGQ